MNPLLLIALGGAIGSILRFLLAEWIYGLIGRNFPYGTLAVNALGSLAIGFLAVLLINRAGTDLKNLLLVGLLGGFTTFSAFALETFRLIEQDEWLKALGNISLSVGLSLIAVWMGIWLAKQL